MVFVRAALLLPFIRISLWLRGFRATQRSLQSRLERHKTARPEIPADQVTQEVSRMVQAAARHLPLTSTCLERSLTLWWMLARHGIATQLRIGARKAGERFEAHAWVERHGVAIGEPDGTHLHYAAFENEFSGELP